MSQVIPWCGNSPTDSKYSRSVVSAIISSKLAYIRDYRVLMSIKRNLPRRINSVQHIFSLEPLRCDDNALHLL